MNLRKFPFDEQECPLILESCKYTNIFYIRRVILQVEVFPRMSEPTSPLISMSSSVSKLFGRYLIQIN